MECAALLNVQNPQCPVLMQVRRDSCGCSTHGSWWLSLPAQGGDIHWEDCDHVCHSPLSDVQTPTSYITTTTPVHTGRALLRGQQLRDSSKAAAPATGAWSVICAQKIHSTQCSTFSIPPSYLCSISRPAGPTRTHGNGISRLWPCTRLV